VHKISAQNFQADLVRVISLGAYGDQPVGGVVVAGIGPLAPSLHVTLFSQKVGQWPTSGLLACASRQPA
jgi:hypothetical protein